MRADQRGIVTLDSARPVTGTYTSIDGQGLLWSMRRPGDAALQSARFEGRDRAPAPESTRLVVERKGQIVAEGTLRIVEAPGITVEVVAEGDVNGAFAAPRTARRAPTLILLHGSEGGSTAGSRAMATRWAGLGYAAFALNWFAYDDAKVAGAPRNVHANQPIEMLAKVRDWLARRPEADVDRLGLYGHSKGAEFAEVAAVHFPWVRAVVACVPSDVVWEGYGFGNTRNSPPRRRPGARSSSCHSAREDPCACTAARQRARRSLGVRTDGGEACGADEARGRGDHVELHVFPRAGHQICGAGTFPTHLYGEPSADPRVKDLVAEGEAASQAWRLTQSFLSKHLDSPARAR